MSHPRILVALLIGLLVSTPLTFTFTGVSPPAFFPAEAQGCACSNEATYALVENGDELTWTLVTDE